MLALGASGLRATASSVKASVGGGPSRVVLGAHQVSTSLLGWALQEEHLAWITPFAVGIHHLRIGPLIGDLLLLLVKSAQRGSLLARRGVRPPTCSIMRDSCVHNIGCIDEAALRERVRSPGLRRPGHPYLFK